MKRFSKDLLSKSGLTKLQQNDEKIFFFVKIFISKSEKITSRKLGTIEAMKASIVPAF